MSELIDLRGQKFGRLTVIERDTSKPRGRAYWWCRCECGKVKSIIADSLRNGRTRSCGCLQRESISTHGMSGTKIYQTWADMKVRCLNPNHKSYPNYGKRGITIYPAWITDFTAFFACVSKLEHYDEPDYSLDRIDNNKGYEPGNVRWATQKQQSRNMRRNHLVEVNGEQITLAEAAEVAGVDINTICGRIRRGWSKKELLKPPQENVQGIDDEFSKIKSEGDIIYIRENPDGLTQAKLAEKFGVNRSRIGAIQRGESYKNAGGTIREPNPHPLKVSIEDRREIRRLNATGNYTQKQLADMFDCSERTIRNIIHEQD